MTTEKLKSGSYRIRQTYNGIRYSVTVPYKPTKKECIQLMAEEMDKIQTQKTRMTFETAANKYMDAKSNVLSPSTLTGYSSSLRNISDKFKKMLISDITSEEVQKEVNRYSAGRSPKTVRNMHGFVMAVMGLYAPNTRIKTTLPQKRKKKDYIPTDEDVRRIIAASKGTIFEIPLILATYGMRRSEICALTADDLDGNVVTISKAYVQNKDKQWVIKTTKTTESTRTIIIPQYAADKIRGQGYVYNGAPNSIVSWLGKTQKKLGIPHFSLHKLRHYYASAAHAAGIPDVYIMAGGGWKTDHVMKNVYRHALNDKKTEYISMADQILESKIF